MATLSTVCKEEALPRRGERGGGGGGIREFPAMATVQQLLLSTVFVGHCRHKESSWKDGGGGGGGVVSFICAAGSDHKDVLFNPPEQQRLSGHGHCSAAPA